MFARLSVDTDLVRGYGASSSRHAVDLQDAARRLGAVGAGAAATFGPVGARFLAALTRAAADEAAAVTALSDAVAAARDAAHGAAEAYESTDGRAGLRVAGLL